MNPIYLFITILIALILIITFGIIFFQYGIKKGAANLLSLFMKSAYEHKVKSFASLNKNCFPGGIVFIGDSITQDYNVYEYFPKENVYNRGIGGDTSLGLLGRLQESVFDLAPKVVFILIGTNDFALLETSIEEISLRIKEIIRLIHIRLPHTQIYVQSVYPVNPNLDSFSVGSRNNRNIKKLNASLKNIENCTFIDLYSSLLDEEGNLNPLYTVEGLHINAKGYEKITEILKEYLIKG
jgi:lysophospholipase L1-like esterase